MERNESKILRENNNFESVSKVNELEHQQISDIKANKLLNDIKA